jgi:hypothetical protein
MSRKLVVILIVLGLLVGTIGRIPVARAGTFSGIGDVGPYFCCFGGGARANGTGYDHGTQQYVQYGSYNWGQCYYYMSGWTISILRDGVTWSPSECDALYAPGLGVINVGFLGDVGTGSHHWVGSASWSYQGVGYTWTFDYTGAIAVYVPPLSVSLTGAFTTQIGIPYTCTATASGGTSPYRYLFSIDWVTVIGGVNNYTEVYTGSLTSSGTFTYTFTFVGEFLIRVTALDAEDNEANDTLDLNAGVNKPALWGQIYDIPDGDPLKTYINFKLFPPNISQDNPPVANGAIQTQFYEITSPGTVEKGSVYYMLNPVLITALPNPLLIYVNYHDPVSGSDWSYVFSFNTTGWAANSGAASNGDTWTGAETPGAFAWLWDLLVKLFRFLFVPSSTDFSAQIAAGWVVITSPVPAVTPQYTIPFPNPNHLLAATGDSVNIDFGVVRDYTGYAIVKTIIQVVLDAILVFVVLSLVA